MSGVNLPASHSAHSFASRRCADLRDRIAAKCNVHLHERSVGKLLKKLNGPGLATAATAPLVTGRSVAVGGY